MVFVKLDVDKDPTLRTGLHLSPSLVFTRGNFSAGHRCHLLAHQKQDPVSALLEIALASLIATLGQQDWPGRGMFMISA